MERFKYSTPGNKQSLTTNQSGHTNEDFFACANDFISSGGLWTSANSVITYDSVEDLGGEPGSLEASTGVFTAPAAGSMMLLIL